MRPNVRPQNRRPLLLLKPVRRRRRPNQISLLVKDQQACCFGVTPQINEFIVVKMPKGVKSVMDTPVEFYGTLSVKEVFEEGFLSQIYTVTAEKMGKTAAE